MWNSMVAADIIMQINNNMELAAKFKVMLSGKTFRLISIEYKRKSLFVSEMRSTDLHNQLDYGYPKPLVDFAHEYETNRWLNET